MQIDFKNHGDKGQFIAIVDVAMTNIILRLLKYINNIVL